ncbi:hypothetical protein [Saccharothrix obliqua]|uniref:hypothetical protein n=1 Tax=Saccharothrix obliqua TaxID=2861747 RepID=UPI001C5E1549|nr:hypothetical protein [Saccharothrix obliqua]MBW4720503.1 hypothetical protein [Saccharothrix obliqua]
MSDAKVLLIDVENVVGPVNPSPQLVRARVAALLHAAGPLHHVMAGYSRTDPANDATVSVLAEMGVAARVVPPGNDAAEKALLEHARYAHERGHRSFAVASADHRFTALRELGTFEVLVWQDQEVALKLDAAADAVHRLPRPTGYDDVAARVGRPPLVPVCPPRGRVAWQLAAAMAAGVGLAVGHAVTGRLLDLTRRRTADPDPYG